MWPAFPASDYYGSSAPSQRHQPTTSLPADQLDAGREGGRQDSSHVHSRTARRGRRPAMPLQPRHDYAAGIHRGLPAGDMNQPKEFPARHRVVRVRVATHPDPPGLKRRWTVRSPTSHDGTRLVLAQMAVHVHTSP